MQNIIEPEIASNDFYHLYKFNDKNFIFDIEKVEAFELDDISFEYLSSLCNEDFRLEAIDLFNYKEKDNTKKLDDKVLPISVISLNVAQVCNLSCTYCYGVDGEYGGKGKMTEVTANKSVDFLFENSQNSDTVCIIFFGGEPLLNFSLLKSTVSYAYDLAKLKDKKVTFSITTNGTKFDEEVNHFLNIHNFTVTISIDGNKDLQDANRPFRGGKGSYDDIFPKITGFIGSRVGKNVTARATVIGDDVNNFKISQHLVSLGFSRVGVTSATISSFAKKNRKIDPEKNALLKNFKEGVDEEASYLLKHIKEKSLEKVKMQSIYNLVEMLFKKKKKKYSCGVGKSLMAISVNGDLYPCHRFVGDDNFKLGSLDDYNSESRNSYTKSFIDEHPLCSKCWAKYQCGGGGCIHDNYITNGSENDINTTYCFKLKYKLKWAINIISSLNSEEIYYLRRNFNVY